MITKAMVMTQPPPRPWTVRPAISACIEGDNALTSAPMKKTAMPNSRTGFLHVPRIELNQNRSREQSQPDLMYVPAKNIRKLGIIPKVRNHDTSLLK